MHYSAFTIMPNIVMSQYKIVNTYLNADGKQNLTYLLCIIDTIYINLNVKWDEICEKCKKMIE